MAENTRDLSGYSPRGPKALLSLFVLSGLISIGLVWIRGNYSVGSVAVVGMPFPEVAFETLDGEAVEFRRYGNRPFVAVFFDYQCGLCDDQLSVLTEVWEGHKSEVTLAGIFAKGSLPEKLKSRLLTYPFEILVVSKNQVRKKLGYFPVPGSFLVNSKGILVHKHSGLLMAGKLDWLISRFFLH